ncbi:VCBS repeat-containing protein [bacterium]|nr:VCBS repeat-containing protein [bacterium]
MFDLFPDGLDDLIVYNQDTWSFEIYRSEGRTFAFVEEVHAPKLMTMADYNTDNHPDLVCAGYTDRILALYLNKCEETPETPVSILTILFLIILLSWAIAQTKNTCRQR